MSYSAQASGSATTWKSAPSVISTSATVESGAIIGPYARLRPGASIGAGAHIGNFVEIKNARIDDGAKANHLSYIGDADVGVGANIGAGTITCNYDGFNKSRTRIGAGAFIGSDTTLVAPVTVGAGAFTAAGSTITQDIPTMRWPSRAAQAGDEAGLGCRVPRPRQRAMKNKG